MTTVVSHPFLPVTEGDRLKGLIPLVREGECLSSDPELFFPLDFMMNKHAKRICAVCPVIKECLEYALENEEVGIWGGTSARERSKMRKLSLAK